RTGCGRMRGDRRSEVRQHLQLRGEVDVADLDGRGRADGDRREVEEAADVRVDDGVDDGLRGGGGDRDDEEFEGQLADGGRQRRAVADRQVDDRLADPRGGGVEDRAHAEAVLRVGEVVGQGGAHAAGAHDAHGTQPVDAQEAPDGTGQLGDVVADAAASGVIEQGE